MAKNKKKKAATWKIFEELRQELVLGLKAKPPATSTSPPPSPKQRNAAYDNSGSCASKFSHSNGSLLPNYEEFENSEEEDEFGPAMSKEDEAYASKFFFSSPMSEMYAKDCLVLHESQAQPIAQEEAAMTAAFLGSDSPLLLSAGTAPMAASCHQASSPPCAMENDVSSFNDGAGVVVSAKGKEKEDVVFLQLQSAAADDVCLLDSFCPSSSFAKGMDVGVCSSSFARENAATLLGNLAAGTDLAKVGDAPFPLPMAAMLDSHGSISSLSRAKVMGDNATTPSTSIVVVIETSMLGKVAGSKAAKTDFARMGAAKTNFVKTAAALGGVLANAAATNGSKDGHASNGKMKDLFSSNRRAESGTKLVHFSELNNAPSCSLLENDLGNLKDVWKYCIVGFLIFRCNVGRQFAYLKLGVLGKPVQCDVLTSSMSHLSFARILVEIDLLADLKHSVCITLPNGASLNQKIVYETLPRFCKHCRVIGHNTSLCPHTLDKQVPSDPVIDKVASATKKVLVKWWVLVKKVNPIQVSPIEQQLSNETSRPLTNEEASRPSNEETSRPSDCEEPPRAKEVQGTYPLNEFLDEQQVDPMQLETNAGEWMVVKKRNGKARVAIDNAVAVTTSRNSISSVGIDINPFCGVTTRSGSRQTDFPPRSKGLKALAPAPLC
ncbi:hypothetical protein OIU76_028424 [Salix suchowensis]|nr:hypothetical protein OIU76_028424 [Salix suchowensis]